MQLLIVSSCILKFSSRCPLIQHQREALTINGAQSISGSFSGYKASCYRGQFKMHWLFWSNNEHNAFATGFRYQHNSIFLFFVAPQDRKTSTVLLTTTCMSILLNPKYCNKSRALRCKCVFFLVINYLFLSKPLHNENLRFPHQQKEKCIFGVNLYIIIKLFLQPHKVTLLKKW